MRYRGTALAVLAATVLIATGCSSSTGDDTAAPDKYNQTWAKSYGATTCAEWAGQMTGEQRWVAAADMLTGARHKDGDDGLPPDMLVDDFAAGVTNVCGAAPSQSITETGAGLYLTERERFSPAGS